MKGALASLRPGEEFERLEQAARSRSEADWIVGMNATRAATIRLRSSFDGAVSLGRVQTPTLAIVARREEEISAFVPEPYWLVDATFAADPLEGAERTYAGHFQSARTPAGELRGPRISEEEQALAIVAACEGRAGTITKLEKKEQREQAPMLYDLTTLQREANNRYGFSAQPHARRRAAPLRGAQGAHLPAHQLALPADRHGRGDQADRGARGRPRRVRARPPSTWSASTCCRSRAW